MKGWSQTLAPCCGWWGKHGVEELESRAKCSYSIVKVVCIYNTAVKSLGGSKQTGPLHSVSAFIFSLLLMPMYIAGRGNKHSQQQQVHANKGMCRNLAYFDVTVTPSKGAKGVFSGAW